MISTKEIQATCDDIVREFAPLQVILFGSYAYGTPTEDSDVDILVVMALLQSETRRQELEMKTRLPTRFRLDLHVRSPEDIAYRVSHNDWFLRDALRERRRALRHTRHAAEQWQGAPCRKSLSAGMGGKRFYESVDDGIGA